MKSPVKPRLMRILLDGEPHNEIDLATGVGFTKVATIRKCCRENGGYVRSMFGGSPTLENTWLALDALSLIERMSNNSSRRQNAGDPLRCCD